MDMIEYIRNSLCEVGNMGYRGVVITGDSESNYCRIVSNFCEVLGLECHIFMPAHQLTDTMQVINSNRRSKLYGYDPNDMEGLRRIAEEHAKKSNLYYGGSRIFDIGVDRSRADAMSAVYYFHKAKEVLDGIKNR